MIVNKRDGNFNFELTTDEERNAFLNILFNSGINLYGKTEYIYEIIFKGCKYLPDSMIDAALENDELSLMISENNNLFKNYMPKLIEKNNTFININLLNKIDDDAELFNKVLSNLIDAKYLDHTKITSLVYNYIGNSLTNLDNFKKLYDIIDTEENIKNAKYTYDLLTYPNIILFINNKDKLEYIYQHIIQKILGFDSKFFTRNSFTSSNLPRSNYLYNIFIRIIKSKHCPIHILEDLSQNRYNSKPGGATIGFVAKTILDKRNQESIV